MKDNRFSFLVSTRNSLALLPIRIGLGVVMMAHGGQKLFGWFGGGGLEGTGKFFEDALGMEPGVLWAFLAGCGEFFGGLLVLVGLVTRFGAFLTGCVMATALFLVHSNAFFLDDNGMEFVLALLAMSIALIIGGGGALSVDRLLQPKSRS